MIGNVNNSITINHLRQENSRTVLRNLHQHQPISRLKLAKQSNVSVATMTRIINNLIEKGLVEEKGAVNTNRGRRPILLQMNTTSRVIASARLSSSRIDLGLVNLIGEILAKNTIAYPAKKDIVGTFRKIKKAIDQLLKNKHLTKEKVLGYGFTLPGFVQPENDFVDASVRLGWKPGPIRTLLESFFGENIYFDALIETEAQEEYYFGPEELRIPNTSTMFLLVGEGIGAALIHNGIVFRGTQGDVGDIGHIPAIKGGIPCKCGNRGCLETLVSKPAILARYKAVCQQIGDKQEISDEDLDAVLSDFLRSKSNCPQLEALLDDIANELAWGVVVGINCYDPTRVVLSGEVFTIGGSALLERVKACVYKSVLHEHRRRIPIQLKQSDGGKNILGAASLVYNGLWKSIGNGG